VPDDRRVRQLGVPPGAGVDEIDDGLVEYPRPGDDRLDLPIREQLRVHVDDPSGKVGEHLTPLVVESEYPRNVIDTGREERQQLVNPKLSRGAC